MTRAELGEATRPRELIPGFPDSIRATASKLRSRADAVDIVNTRLRRLDLSGVWEGTAANSFLNAVSELRPHLDYASEADRTAGEALRTYAQTVDDAQTDAGRAINLWQRGEEATDAAKREGLLDLSGRAHGVLLLDPGQSQRVNAERILNLARDEVRDAGNRATSALRDGEAAHASSIGVWDLVGVMAGSVLRGAGNEVASLANAVARHPDEYWSIVLGMVSIEGGAAAFAGGVAVDASGVGAPVGVAVNVASAAVVVSGVGLVGEGVTRLSEQAAGQDRVEPFTSEAAGSSDSAGYLGSGFDEESTVSDAAGGSGNFGLGSGTAAQAQKAGRAWVGEGYRVASDGKTLISGDGLRAWRPPTLKPKLGIWQSNFEKRQIPQGPFESNGHLNISDKP